MISASEKHPERSVAKSKGEGCGFRQLPMMGQKQINEFPVIGRVFVYSLAHSLTGQFDLLETH
jgi:hypothetical protein